MQQLDVYAFGSALMDIQVQVEDTIFDELSITKGNMYLTERSRQEEVLKKILNSDQIALEQLQQSAKTAAGGSAANTVYGIAQLGGKSGLCGKVAHDTFGDLYVRQMRESNVIFNTETEPGMTGTCIVLISDDAQRTMLTCLGVSSEITYADINEDLLKNSRYMYIEGYLLDSEVATQTIHKAIETAKKHNVLIALTASDAFCIQRHKKLMLDIIREDVALLFANAEEARALSDTDDTTEAIRALSAMGVDIAVTDGSNGSLVHINGTTTTIAPFPVQACDTTGAGDSYAAGLLFGLTNGRSVSESGNIASRYSSRVVAQLGPRFSGDIRTELKKEGVL